VVDSICLPWPLDIILSYSFNNIPPLILYDANVKLVKHTWLVVVYCWTYLLVTSLACRFMDSLAATISSDSTTTCNNSSWWAPSSVSNELTAPNYAIIVSKPISSVKILWTYILICSSLHLPPRSHPRLPIIPPYHSLAFC